MFMNILIIGVWVTVIGLFGIGFYVKDVLEEKKKMKKREERLWLV